jgi:hypothetical protein
MLKLAGYVNKRTFAVIRNSGTKFDFAPALITNTIPKALADIEKRRATNADSRVDWKLHVLLDNGDWHLIDGDNYNYYA